jgi:protein-L-isoaspartate(D-aspartate) O-methyltransferase
MAARLRRNGASSMSDGKTEAQRLQMINGQLRTSDVNDLELLAAFAAVPREAFVAAAQRPLAYADGEVLSAGPAGRKLLSPRTIGLMFKAAAPVKGERALTVGGGAGYCAALLAALGLDVVALETDSSAARASGLTGVACVDGPLSEPPAGKGPFDVIILNGAFEVAPDRLVAALSPRGRLVGVSALSNAKRIVIFERSGGGVSERSLYDAAGDVLPGFARAPAFAF